MNEFTLADLHEGFEQSFEVNLDESKHQKFVEISGDHNPFHVNQIYAQSKGFKDKVMHGLLSSAFYSTLVGIYLPGKYAILHSIDIKFLKPVFINDTLRIIGVVTYINEAYKQIEVKAHINNQDGIKISKATIKIGLLDG